MEMTTNEQRLLARIAELEANQKSRGTYYKVSTKGALSRYGMGRFPVTLYRTQWEQIIADVKSGTLEQELKANAHLLKSKGE